MGGDRFGRFGHRLQKIVLRGQAAPQFLGVLGLSGRVNPRFSGRRGDADGDVLDRAAESAHRVPLEMRKNHHEIVLREVRAYDVVFEVPAALDGQAHFALGVHDVHRSDGRESVVGGGFQVVFGLGASAAVGRVALDDRALHRLHQIADQGRLQEIVASRLSGREFHGDLLPFGLPAQGLVDGFHSRGRDVAGHVDFGGSRLRRLFVVARRTAGTCGREMQNKGDHTDFFHHGYLRITYFIKRYPPNTCNNMPGIPIRKSCTAAVKLPVKAHSPADPTIW